MNDLSFADWLQRSFECLPYAAVVAEFIGGHWSVVYVNQAYTALTGCPAADVLGQAQVLPLALAGDRTGWDVIESAIERQASARSEIQLLRKDGAARWVEVAIAPVANGEGNPTRYVTTLADITERRKTHDALLAQRDQLLDYVAHAPLGILALDWVMNGVFIIEAGQPNRPIIYVNAAFERLTGLAGEAVIGRNFDVMFTDAGNAAVREQIHQAMLRQEELKTELHSVRQDGTGFWSELSLAPVSSQQTDTTHYLGILNDITERKLHEQRLSALSDELRKSRDNLLSILDEFPSGTLIMEASGTLAFCSANCHSILGIQPDTALSQDWRRVLPFDSSAVEQIQRCMQTPKSARQALVIPWRDGGGLAHWVECSIKDDPLDPSRRLLFLDDITELHRLRDRLEASRFAGLLGESEAMRTLNRLIGDVARGNWTVLIEGETGVGKELVARAIHQASPRAVGPFIAVNSAGLSESLLASQLFGHRKGSFTGATSDQAGFFEAATGGTLFLDEIGDLPLPMQASLLRVLQEHEITRIGETRSRAIDVRIIAATHRDLAAEARAGRFREDLLFRLRVARIDIPPLRARKTDIPLLVGDFLSSANTMAGKTILALEPDASQCLLDYDWPGNVRELRASIDFAVIHCQGSRISANDLPPEIRALRAAALAKDEPEMDDAEATSPARILAALQKTRGNRSRAADLLGVSRSTFYRRLREMGADQET